MYSIKEFNTFNLNILVKDICLLKNKMDLKKNILFLSNKKENYYFLGKGSNILFLENFYGIILINKIKGIKIKQNINFWYLIVYSGELFSKFINFSLNNKIFGLENLANIPGTVGSAIVNNIGAYGLEIKKFVYYVKVLDIYTGLYCYFNNFNCYFSYRFSIFKSYLYKRFIIIKVIFRIFKKWEPCIFYKDLFFYFNKSYRIITPLKIYKRVVYLRKLKLPNYKIFGNIGSIFKNPIISIKKFIKLKYIYYKYFNNIKYNYFFKYIRIPAALLIDICNLKGYTIGKAQIYIKQPLIIINMGGAKPLDIYKLLNLVKDKVFYKFNILLELEIEIIKYNYIYNKFI